MFRPDSEPLTPNWKHLPIGYHGRAGTVVDLRHAGRPARAASARRRRTTARRSARRSGWTSRPRSASSSARPSELGTPVPLERLRRPRLRRLPGERLVGPRPAVVGVRARSARSSASLSSPRCRRGSCPCAALEAARVTPPARDPRPLPYLDDADAPWGLDISLEVRLNGELVSRPPFGQHVLDRRAAARPHDRQRGIAAHRRPVRLRHGARPAARPARLVHRAVMGRQGAADPRRRHDQRRSSRTATSCRSPPPHPGPDGTRLAFGEVTGRIEPAR